MNRKLDMMNREQLTAELDEIEGSYVKSITPAKQKRARDIIRILCQCECRQCGNLYDRQKSRATYTGYCSSRCMNTTAKQLGYRKGMSMYHILRNAQMVGDKFIVPPQAV